MSSTKRAVQREPNWTNDDIVELMESLCRKIRDGQIDVVRYRFRKVPGAAASLEMEYCFIAKGGSDA